MKTYLVGGDEEFLNGVKNMLSNTVEGNVFAQKHVSPDLLKENLPDCEILVASPSAFEYLSEDHLECMPKLKFITTISVGTDWIDLEAAKKRGIIVSNEKGVNAEAVAEHCFGMIMSLTKRITEADRGLRERSEQRAGIYEGIEIYKKTIGIVGLGDIGKKVVRIAKGFDMTTLGMNKSGTAVEGVELTDLHTLLQQSDVVVLTVPLNSETENMISTKELSLMKEGAVLVSISREKVIDQEAVLQTLKSNKLLGFGFDAEIAVPMDEDDPFLAQDRVIITPHTASVTKEAIDGYATMTVENIEAFLEDSPLRVVN